MKTKLFLLSAFFVMAIGIPSDAAVFSDQVISEQYMRNAGYSESTYDTAQLVRHRALGQEYYGKKESDYAKTNKTARFFKQLRAYTDPGIDDFSFYHHDIDNNPSYHDL